MQNSGSASRAGIEHAADVSSRTVDVHIVALRKKIEADPKHPRFLKTVHGVGYKLICDIG